MTDDRSTTIREAVEANRRDAARPASFIEAETVTEAVG